MKYFHIRNGLPGYGALALCAPLLLLEAVLLSSLRPLGPYTGFLAVGVYMNMFAYLVYAIVALIIGIKKNDKNPFQREIRSYQFCGFLIIVGVATLVTSLISRPSLYARNYYPVVWMLALTLSVAVIWSASIRMDAASSLKMRRRGVSKKPD